MSFSVGIVGLPNVGKSTLFNALTCAGAQVANYPFTTIDPNTGVVAVPDARLDRVAAIAHPEHVTPTTVEFVDIAGLVRGASHGEGLGNQFLGHIRTVEAIVMVIRCFTDSNVAHVDGSIEPLRDIGVISTELALADLATIARRMERTLPVARSGDKHAQAELALLERLGKHVNDGRPARQFERHGNEATILAELQLLTDKPILYVANIDEQPRPHDTPVLAQIQSLAAREGAEFVALCAQIEADLAALAPAEAAEYRAALSVTDSGLDLLIRASYRLLELVTFFTATGTKEVRAWTVQQGARAPQAAGKVHSDMERGFIRAEVVSFADLDRYGNVASAREHGLVRLEGRDYIVQDGDIIHFRFSPP